MQMSENIEEMAPSTLICRFRVNKPENYDANAEKSGNSAVFDIKDCPEIEIETRKQWMSKVMEHFEIVHGSIIPWDFLGELDGSIKLLSLPATECSVYPTRFQIPLETISELDPQEKIKRTGRFALASLLYEILSGKKVFEELTDDEVQCRFRNAAFPDDAVSLPNSLLLYSGWSEEFSQELAKKVAAQDQSLIQKITGHAKAHPIRTGFQIGGLTLFAVSSLAVPILGAVGFTAAGPAAGSAAAAWQASIGVVEAGSLFAWCQSAAMGGTAVAGLQWAGIAGTAITRISGVPDMIDVFKKVYRTANRQAEQGRLD